MPWEEDEFEERRIRRGGPSFGYVRASEDLLAPRYSTSHRRSRSQSQGLAPNISIYNSTRAEADSRSPSPLRGRSRSRDRVDTQLLDRLENAEYQLGRARSKGRSDAPPYYRDMQVTIADERARRDMLEDRLLGLQRQYEDQRRRDEERLADADQRWRQLEEDRRRDAEWQSKADRDEELWRRKSELRRLKDRIEASEADTRLTSRLELEDLKREQKLREAELKRKEEREQILAQREKEERDAKEERKRIKMEIELKEKEEEEERKRMIAEFQQKEAEKKKQQDDAAARAIAEFEKKKADEKRKEEDMKAKFKAEEEEAKRKAKEEKEAWKLKFELEQKEEEEKKKQHERELEEEMRRKMSKFGFQDNQIEAVLHPKKADELSPGALPNQPLVPVNYRRPTYIKIHKDHIDIETLKYFGLPWEYDTMVSPDRAEKFSWNVALIGPRTATILSYFKSSTPARQISCSSTPASYAVKARRY